MQEDSHLTARSFIKGFYDYQRKIASKRLILNLEQWKNKMKGRK